jgi:hypothetical protein
MMRQKKTKRRGLRGGLAAAFAAVAFALFLLDDAFSVAHRINGALLSAGDFFRRTVPLGTLIASVLFLVLVAGLIWFHLDRLENCWKRISALPPARYLLGAIFIAGLIVVPSLLLLPDGDLDKMPPRVTQPPQIPDPPQSNPAPSPSNPTRPIPRMTGRNVCDLFDDATDDELTACVTDLARHPNRKGIGGPVCVETKFGNQYRIKCLPWPIPLPRSRPPMNILPN